MPVSWLRVGCAAWTCQPPTPTPPSATARPALERPPTYPHLRKNSAACGGVYLPTPLGSRGKVCPWVYPWKRNAALTADVVALASSSSSCCCRLSADRGRRWHCCCWHPCLRSLLAVPHTRAHRDQSMAARAARSRIEEADS
eukprot:COSAG06_NODE_826_length_12064_cov_8.219975_14_plen_142_part_00